MEQSNLRFPLFIDLNGKVVVVIGGGRIARRRVDTLLQFGALVRVIAPDAQEIPAHDRLQRVCRMYQNGDLQGALLAVAATNDRLVNQLVAQEAGERSVPVSVADQPELCSFYFPAVCMGQNLVAGVVSDGTAHHQTAKAAQRMREVFMELDAEHRQGDV